MTYRQFWTGVLLMLFAAGVVILAVGAWLGSPAVTCGGMFMAGLPWVIVAWKYRQ